MLGSTGLGDTYIFPDDTELYDTFRNGSDLKSSLVFGMLLEERRVFQGGYKIYRRYESAMLYSRNAIVSSSHWKSSPSYACSNSGSHARVVIVT